MHNFHSLDSCMLTYLTIGTGLYCRVGVMNLECVHVWEGAHRNASADKEVCEVVREVVAVVAEQVIRCYAVLVSQVADELAPNVVRHKGLPAPA